MPDIMEMHQLRYFVAVAEELHFGRAARRENVSQPPLSLQIKKLEEELQVTLFERTKRRVAITPAGSAFLPEAKSILAATSHAKHVAQKAYRGEIGQVRIGFVHSASLGYLPSLIGPFRQIYPQIEIRLHEMTVSEQNVALAKGRIDIGIVRPPIENPQLASFDVVSEPFCAVVPVDHWAASETAIELNALADEDFVFYPQHRSPAFYQQLMTMCSSQGFLPRTVVEANTMYTAIGLAGTGAGVAIVPQSVSCIAIPSVRYISLTGLTEKATLTLVHSDTKVSQSTRKLIEFAYERL